MTVDLHLGDCRDVFATCDLFDAFIQDPPGGGNFMSAEFDSDRGGRDRWVAWLAERLRVAFERTVPGGYLSCWAFPRLVGWTHRAVEDAGWQPIGKIEHLHGQGWPKAGEAALKPAAEPWILARKPGPIRPLGIDGCRVPRNWDERGEAWKRSGHSAKPDADKIGGAPAGNGMRLDPGGSWPTDVVIEHCAGCEYRGTTLVRSAGSKERHNGADNKIYGAGDVRVSHGHGNEDGTETVPAWECVVGCDCGASFLHPAGGDPPPCQQCGGATWWACAYAEVSRQSGERTSGLVEPHHKIRNTNLVYGEHNRTEFGRYFGGDTGSGARFFPTFHPLDLFHYFAKAPTSERDAGCEHLLWAYDKKRAFNWRRIDRAEYERLPANRKQAQAMGMAAEANCETGHRRKPWGMKSWRASGCVHPTVKKIAFMRWQVRLLAPEQGMRVGDQFGGTCTTAIACALENRHCVISDVSPEAIEIGWNRLQYWHPMGVTVHGWTPPAYDYWVPPEEPRPEREHKRVKVADARQVNLFGG